jgi:integrase/recombinase XerD
MTLIPYKPSHPARRFTANHELMIVAQKIEWLTEPEYIALCAAAENKEHKLLIRLLWETGLRIHEALGLRYADVYPDGLNIIGKGGKQRFVHCQAGILGDLLRYTREHADQSPTKIFQKIRTRQAANLMLKRYAIKSGLQKRIHNHLFRHSYAINFMKQTQNPWALQEQGGWSDMEIIKVYLRLSRELAKEAVQRMNFPEV